MTRTNYIHVTDNYNLNLACAPLNQAFREQSCGIFQCGSSLLRPSFRDVDVRCMFFDEEFDKWFGGPKAAHSHPLLNLLNVTISEWLSRRTNLPIDFQIQRMTDANAEFPKGNLRNAVGLFLKHQPIDMAEPEYPASPPGTIAVAGESGVGK